MYFTIPTIALVAGLLTSSVSAAPLETRQTAEADGFGLSINGGRFDISYLQTLRISYANSSAYLGEIKYQAYSEPLVVSGANIAGASDGLSFLSIHSSPRVIDMYVVPHQSKPVGFSPAHGSAPTGVRTTGFTFNSAGNLLNNGYQLFYACQNAADAEINSYQIYWVGADQPNGLSCKGPLDIKMTDGAARS